MHSSVGEGTADLSNEKIFSLLLLDRCHREIKQGILSLRVSLLFLVTVHNMLTSLGLAHTYHVGVTLPFELEFLFLLHNLRELHTLMQRVTYSQTIVYLYCIGFATAALFAKNYKGLIIQVLLIFVGLVL